MQMKSNKISVLASVLEFIKTTEELKKLLRHSWLSDNRQESVAEHTWRMALMAIVIHPHLDFSADLNHTLKLIIIHDLAEILAGDYHAFKNVPQNKHQLEKKSLQKLLHNLPIATQNEIVSLWEEFEDNLTPEAKFAQSLDKLEVLIQHNQADISTWDEKEYDFNYYF